MATKNGMKIAETFAGSAFEINCLEVNSYQKIFAFCKFVVILQRNSTGLFILALLISPI